MMRQPIVLEISGTTDASGNATLRSNPLRRSGILALQWASFYSASTANAVATLSVEIDGYRYRIYSGVCATAGLAYGIELNVFVPADAVVRLDVSAGGNTQPFVAVVFGYLQYQ